MAATIDYVDTDQIESTTNTFTFNNVGTGTANADRHLGMVVQGTQQTGASATITNLTVEGNAASHLRTANGDADAGGNSAFTSLWIIALPTGTDADIAVTFDDNMFDCMVHTFEIHGADPAEYDFATVSDDQAASVDLSLDVPAGGVAFGGLFSYQHSAAAHVWTGFTKRVEVADFGNSNRGSAADYEAASAQTPLDVDVALTNFTTGVNDSSIAAAAVSLAAAATFQTAWARGSNVLIGGGP